MLRSLSATKPNASIPKLGYEEEEQEILPVGPRLPAPLLFLEEEKWTD